MRNKLFPHAGTAWALSLNEGYAAQNPDPAQNLVLLGFTWFYLVLPCVPCFAAGFTWFYLALPDADAKNKNHAFISTFSGFIPRHAPPNHK